MASPQMYQAMRVFVSSQGIISLEAIMKSIKRVIGPLLLISILVIQLATPTVALADDPPAAEETPAVAPADPPADAPTGAEETPAVAPADSPADVPAAPEPTPTVAEILEAAPEGTEVVVVDADGEEVPLDTLEAVEVIAASDPVWCPDTVSLGDPLCTQGADNATITTLLAALANPTNGYAGAGTIYFQEGAYAGGETNVFISSSALPNLTALTLSGGWDIAGTGTQTGVTTFIIPIVINWNNDVTIEDIVVDFAAPSSNNGVYVSTTGDISLDGVTTNNGSTGADLSNYAGTGDVDVANSSFNNSTNTGLRIESSGAVDVDSVNVNGNNTGVYIDNTSGTASVIVTNLNGFGNDTLGLDVRSSGSISVTGTSLTDSYQGMNLDATSGTGGITITNFTLAIIEDLGVKAITGAGNIVITNLDVDNDDYAGSMGAWVKSYSGGTITITDSMFVNADTGLFVVGTNDVLLDNVIADGNAGNGVEIQSGWVFACIPPEGINVTINGTVASNFTNNGGYGFAVYPGPTGSLTLAGTINFLANTNGDYLLDLTRTCTPCPEEDDKPAKPYKIVEVPDTGGTPEPTNCDESAGTILVLPDGSTVKVGCPAEGDFTVERLTEDKLPGPLPLGPLFVDSLTIGLTVGEGGSALLKDGGYYLLSFKIPEELKGKRFAIVFWDVTLNSGSGGWLELPYEQFAGQVFPLHPKTPEDGMQVLRGVYVYDGAVSAKVNFTGTFALIAR
jgi:hypothetical protein